ncbi:MAG: N-acetylglucosamine-6-phosphate deacetylase [Bacteroidetes bacterium]|nr:N-acetylglucosamine-6-phosphate deacetylase [Bacteroidota bacterium]
MQERKIYTASRVFTGETWLSDHAIITRNGIIEQIIPSKDVDAGTAVIPFPEQIIAPAFLDLQLYGAAGKLLAVYPETDSLYRLNEHCNKGGTVYCLPTVATNTKETVFNCIDAIRHYWAEGGKGIGGLHIEGPWIHPQRRGAHVESLIHVPTKQEVSEFLDYGKGIIKMITLAPEQCTDEILDLIRSNGIIISAGHSNATYTEAKKGFARGITTVTHLFNAMSPLQHRAPGLAGATMDDAHVMASIIPDGHHVDFAAVRIAKKAMQERLFVITDAVTDTTSGYYQHQLGGDKYEAGGILSGSALTMIKAVQLLVQNNVADIGEALRMCSLYPARVMQIDHVFGMLQPGRPVNMVVLDEAFNLTGLLQD